MIESVILTAILGLAIGLRLMAPVALYRFTDRKF